MSGTQKRVLRVTQRTIASAILAILVLWPLYLLTGPWFYIALPIEGRVVDAETKEPLSGVIIVALWELDGGIHVDTVGFLEAAEAVTDNDGKYRIDGWGPKARPFGSHLSGSSDPWLIFYKYGYRAVGKLNGGGFQIEKSAIRSSLWDKKTIEMKRFGGSISDYSKQLRSFDISIDWIRYDRFKQGKCLWKKIPRLLIELDKVHKEVKKSYPLVVAGRVSSIEDIQTSNRCGSPKNYFRKK